MPCTLEKDRQFHGSCATHTHGKPESTPRTESWRVQTRGPTSGLGIPPPLKKRGRGTSYQQNEGDLKDPRRAEGGKASKLLSIWPRPVLIDAEEAVGQREAFDVPSTYLCGSFDTALRVGRVRVRQKLKILQRHPDLLSKQPLVEKTHDATVSCRALQCLSKRAIVLVLRSKH